MLPIKNRFLIFKEDIIKDVKTLVMSKKLRILHFNDVYNIEESIEEPVGGAARFCTALNLLKEETPSLVLFSGDALR
jgi:hypothetical protein